MSADYFLDTNVLVYSFDDREPTKRDTAQKLIAQALRQGCGVISWQVVQEFLNVALHKWEVPMTTGDATAYLSGTRAGRELSTFGTPPSSPMALENPYPPLRRGPGMNHPDYFSPSARCGGPL